MSYLVPTVVEQTPSVDSLLLVLCFAMIRQSKAAEEIFRQHGGILRMSAALEAGTPITRVCRDHGVSRSMLYKLFPGGLPRVRVSLAG